MSQATILQTILARKSEEVAAASALTSLQELQARANDMPPCRGFTKALKQTVSEGRSAVISEIKKASPSKGVIRENFFPSKIAKAYADAGASCLSVLTDEDFFQGHATYLNQARDACELPALRKDFMINDYHIAESRAMGADCILLIVSAFDQSTLMEDLYAYTLELGMDALIEVHDEAELDRALALKPAMVGVNNRNLHTFETNLDTSLTLQAKVPANCLLITESGIHTVDDVARMRSNDINAFLVGEAFMRAEDPGAALATLFN